MKENTRFFTHSKALWALFIMGNAVITLPVKSANEFTFLGFISAALLGAAAYIIAVPLAKKLFTEEIKPDCGILLKILLSFVYLAVAVFAVFCAADTFADFTLFIKKIVLTDTSMFFISVIFLVVALYFYFRRQEDILKFFLIAFFIVMALVVFFFIFTAFKFNLRYIFVFELPTASELFSQAKPYILNPVIPALLLPFYNACVFKKVKLSHTLAGLTLGFLMLAVCVIGTCLLFGTVLAGRLPYPYSSAISTVSIGRLFTRLDGFSYFIYFAAVLAKITVCTFVAKSSFIRISHFLMKKEI